MSSVLHTDLLEADSVSHHSKQSDLVIVFCSRQTMTSKKIRILILRH